jgi:hypothetical protein
LEKVSPASDLHEHPESSPNKFISMGIVAGFDSTKKLYILNYRQAMASCHKKEWPIAVDEEHGRRSSDGASSHRKGTDSDSPPNAHKIDPLSVATDLS